MQSAVSRARYQVGLLAMFDGWLCPKCGVVEDVLQGPKHLHCLDCDGKVKVNKRIAKKRPFQLKKERVCVCGKTTLQKYCSAKCCYHANKTEWTCPCVVKFLGNANQIYHSKECQRLCYSKKK